MLTCPATEMVDGSRVLYFEQVWSLSLSTFLYYSAPFWYLNFMVFVPGILEISRKAF
jgi:hypothetical protein